MQFFKQFMNIQKNDRILDYGCGVGTMVEYLTSISRGDVYGFDVRPYFDKEPFWFRTEYYFTFHKVYFMHSIAHIESLATRLIELKELLEPNAEVFVLTPNKLWLDNMINSKYKPDPTVVKHRTQGELTDVFQSAGYRVTGSGQFGVCDCGQNERIFLRCTI